LRRLAFVKLQDKQSGQLLSLVTNDIELLEVFYAHTIAPIAIAFLTSGIYWRCSRIFLGGSCWWHF